MSRDDRLVNGLAVSEAKLLLSTGQFTYPAPNKAVSRIIKDVRMCIGPWGIGRKNRSCKCNLALE